MPATLLLLAVTLLLLAVLEVSVLLSPKKSLLPLGVCKPGKELAGLFEAAKGEGLLLLPKFENELFGWLVVEPKGLGLLGWLVIVKGVAPNCPEPVEGVFV